MPNNNLLTKRLQMIMRSLPQYTLIQGRVDEWINNALKAFPDHAETQAIKLGGFSSSEIGVLVSNFDGVVSQSGNAHEIVSRKLLHTMPELSSQFQRDIMMEPIHRQLFMEKHKRLGCSIDNDLLYKFMYAQGSRVWMRYCPNDVVVMNFLNKNLCVAVDYHSPVSIGQDLDHVDYEYLCQLHQGYLVASHNKFPIDMIWVSRLNYENFSLIVNNIRYDKTLAEKIIEAGDSYWNMYVMNDLIPPELELSTKSIKSFKSESNLVRQILPVAPGETNIGGRNTATEVLQQQQGVPTPTMRGKF